MRSDPPFIHAVCLFFFVATFVLHHPEHGHAVLHALLSCVIDGTLIYNKKTPPFGSFVSLFSPSTEVWTSLGVHTFSIFRISWLYMQLVESGIWWLALKHGETSFPVRFILNQRIHSGPLNILILDCRCTSSSQQYCFTTELGKVGHNNLVGKNRFMVQEAKETKSSSYM